MNGCHMPTKEDTDPPIIRDLKEMAVDLQNAKQDILSIDGQLEGISDWMMDKQEALKDHDEKINDFENIAIEKRLIALESKELAEKLDPKVWVFVNERLDKLERSILETRIQFIDQLGNDRRPYRCPICNGTTFCSEGMCCVPCDGTGIVWG